MKAARITADTGVLSSGSRRCLVVILLLVAGGCTAGPTPSNRQEDGETLVSSDSAEVLFEKNEERLALKLSRIEENWPDYYRKITANGRPQDYWAAAEFALYKSKDLPKPGESFHVTALEHKGEWNTWLRRAAEAYEAALDSGESEPVRIRLLLCLAVAFPESRDEFWRHAKKMATTENGAGHLLQAYALFVEENYEQGLKALEAAAHAERLSFYELRSHQMLVRALRSCGLNDDELLTFRPYNIFSEHRAIQRLRDICFGHTSPERENVGKRPPFFAARERTEASLQAQLGVARKLVADTTSYSSFFRWKQWELSVLAQKTRWAVRWEQHDQHSEAARSYARALLTFYGLLHHLSRLREAEPTVAEARQFFQKSLRYGSVIALCSFRSSAAETSDVFSGRWPEEW